MAARETRGCWLPKFMRMAACADLRAASPEQFFNALNPELMQIFEEDVTAASDEFRFPLQHEALICEEGRHRVRISGEIGRGGMKIIYKCQPTDEDRVIALATMKKKAEPQAVERFLREAKILSSLTHYNIIRKFRI